MSIFHLPLSGSCVPLQILMAEATKVVPPMCLVVHEQDKKHNTNGSVFVYDNRAVAPSTMPLNCNTSPCTICLWVPSDGPHRTRTRMT